MLFSASDKAKLFAKTFSKNSNLEDSGIYLTAFPSGTNLKQENISVIPKMVKKVITNLDSSKVSDHDCIPVVVLKNCEPEFSYILAERFSMCLKEYCFQDCWKVSSVVPVFKDGERSTAKNYRPAIFLSVVSKVLEKLVNNRLVDHLEKCSLFSDFQHGFRSLQSTADLDHSRTTGKLTSRKTKVIPRDVQTNLKTPVKEPPLSDIMSELLSDSDGIHEEVAESSNTKQSKINLKQQTGASTVLISIKIHN